MLYLRDQPVGPFLLDPVLAPFAVLGDVPDGERRQVLRRALDRIAADLAYLYLDPATIGRTWEESAMPIPSLTHQIYTEGHAEGLAEGQARERRAVIGALLRRRFGDTPGVDATTEKLAELDIDRVLTRIEQASSLDELAG